MAEALHATAAEAPGAAPALAQPGLLLPAISLGKRELVRFFRQRGRVIGALLAPLLFWLFIGAGLKNSFRIGGVGVDYLEYAFPGTIIMIVLFTSIFSSISTIEDRREGFLQSVLVAPVSRAGIVLGKVFGAAAIATIQGFFFLLLAPVVGIHVPAIAFVAATGTIALVAFGLSALGFLAAWRTDSVQGFHAVMNLVLMPMWLLSGALFPAAEAQGWLRAIMLVNPLTYGLEAIRGCLYADPPGAFAPLGVALAVSAAFAAVMFAAAVAIAAQERRTEPSP